MQSLIDYITACWKALQSPPVLPSDSSASKKYDLVLCDPEEDELDDWRQDLQYSKQQGNDCFAGIPVFPKNKNGWCCYLVARSEFYDPQVNESFDCCDFPDSFHDREGASDDLVKYLYDWMFYNHCGYEMEGFVGFYGVDTKDEAIQLLKTCPVIGTIYEIVHDIDNTGLVTARVVAIY